MYDSDTLLSVCMHKLCGENKFKCHNLSDSWMLKIVFLITAITPCFMGNHAEPSLEITSKHLCMKDAILINKLYICVFQTEYIIFK